MRISYAPLWLAATNCYVLAPGEGGPGVIVDAPPDPAAIVDLVRRSGVEPAALLLTHGHLDHVGGAGRAAAAFGIPAYLHPADEPLAADMDRQARLLLGMGGGGAFTGAEHYEPLEDGQMLDIAGLRIRVLHTPGHTPGHCCLHLEDEGVLFSGDHLFAGSVGRTDLPGGDHSALLRSMAARLVPLPGDTDVLPGHGPATTLAWELATNPFLQDLPS